MFLTSCADRPGNRILALDHAPRKDEVSALNNIIILCTLPDLYYRWDIPKTFLVKWKTTSGGVSLDDKADKKIQDCVNREVLNSKLQFTQGVSGTVEVKL